MADISSIDGYINPWRSSINQSPSQDFADELAKEANKAQSDRRTHLKDEKDTSSDAHAEAKGGNEGAADTRTQGEVAAQAGRLAPGSDTSRDSGMPDAKVAAFANAQQLLGTVVQPIGVTEALLASRLFGMHLLAGTYLSELTLSEDPTSDATFDAVKAVQSSAIPLDEQTTTAGSRSSPGMASPEEQSPAAALVMQVAQAQDEAAETSYDASSQTAAATGSTGAPVAQWLERSLRFTKQADGSTVAWLRDYRVGGHEAADLRDSLVKEAKAKGVVLGKIMLNGREVWTSRSDT
jgi:hypothetical protein